MTQYELIKFLNRVFVWIPQNNPMRAEIKQVVESLGGRVSEVAPYVPCQNEQLPVQQETLWEKLKNN